MKNSHRKLSTSNRKTTNPDQHLRIFDREARNSGRSCEFRIGKSKNLIENQKCPIGIWKFRIANLRTRSGFTGSGPASRKARLESANPRSGNARVQLGCVKLRFEIAGTQKEISKPHKESVRSTFPAFSRRGGCAINKMTSFLSGADKAVSNFSKIR